MIKIRLLFILATILLPYLGYSQYDSLVVYHRTFCSDYGKVNNDINRIKDFSVVIKKSVLDEKRIQKVLSKLEKLKLYRQDTPEFSNGYLLGAYSYREGKEELLFTISTFHRLTYKNTIYSYPDKFLDLLLAEKPPCYF